jgi:hypothetical protein
MSKENDPLRLDEVYATSQRVQMADPLIIAMDTKNAEAMALAKRLLGAKHVRRHRSDPFIVATVDWKHPHTVEIVRHLFTEEEFRTIDQHEVPSDHYRILMLMTHTRNDKSHHRYHERPKPLC